MAAPAFRAAGSIASDLTGAASVTVTLPTHQAGDILIVSALNDGGDTMSIATSGWAEITSIAATDDAAWFWKRATSSSETNPVVESASTDCFAIAYSFSGCVASGTPFEDATTNNKFDSPDDNPDTSLITTTGPDRLVVSFLNINDNPAWSNSPPPSGWTLNDDQNTSSGTDAGFTVISKSKATAGDESAVQIGRYITVSEPYGTMTLALIPNTPPTVSLSSPTDAATGQSTTPALTFTGTDPDSDDIRYEVQVDTVNTFNSTVNSYYFDVSDAGPTDPNSVFTNDANAFDGSIGTVAIASASGSTSSNYLLGEGTNAPSSGGGIMQVRARVNVAGAGGDCFAAIYTDGLGELLGTPSETGGGDFNGWGSYVTLSVPTGGWTWAKVQALETKIYFTTPSSNQVSKVEIEVTSILLDKVSGTDSGFSGSPDNTDPFASAQAVTYTVQGGDALAASTTYYWRVRGIDPSGSNTYGEWSSTRSFTTEAGGTNITVNAGVLTSTSSVQAPTVTAIKNVSVSAGVLTTTSSVQAPTVTTIKNVSITSDVVTATSSVQSATISIGDSVTAGVMTATASVQAPTVTAVQNTSISSDVVTATSSVQAPTVTAIKNVSITSDVVTATSSIQEPTVTSGIQVDADVVSAIFSVQAPTVTAVKNVSLTSDVVSATSSVQAPTVTAVKNVSISADVLSVTSSVQSPTVSAIKNVNITSDVVIMTGSVQSQTVSIGDSVTSGVITISSTIPAPTITTTSTITISADVLTSISSVQAPSINIDDSVTSDILTATATVQAPTITAIQNATISDNVQALTSSVQAPSISAIKNVTISPNSVDFALSVQSPSISTSGAITVNPNAVAIIASVQAPTITAVKNVNISSDVVTATLSHSTATITAIKNVSVSADTVTATLSVQAPTITGIRNATISPNAQIITASVVNPSVIVNESNIADVLTATFTIPAPSVSVDGSLDCTVTPDVIQIGARKIITLDGKQFGYRINPFLYTKI